MAEGNGDKIEFEPEEEDSGIVINGKVNTNMSQTPETSVSSS